MMESLLPFLIADALLLIGTFALVRRQMTFIHPATYYYFYHLYAITIPAWALFFGALPMYAGSSGYLSISEEEYARALVFAGAALVSFIGGCHWAQQRAKRRSRRLARGHELSKSTIHLVVAVCLPLGLFFFSLGRGFVDADTGLLAESGYARTLAMWPMACLLLCVFRFGFRWYLLLPIMMYLGFVGLQGYHRFMLVLPLLFLGAIYLHRRQLRWPPHWVWGAALAIVLIFPQLKYIGRAVQTNNNELAVNLVKQAFFLAPRDEAVEYKLLDPYAGALTLVDEYGKTYYGSTYLALLTLPVPRFLWPEKPGLADHVIAMSTSARPYDVEGRAISYIAESYINFGYLGVLLVPLGLGLLLTRWHAHAMAGPPLRVDQILYLSVAVSLLQVYRDGLASLIVFSVINNTPILLAWLIHRATGAGRRVFPLMNATRA